jgi:hypothetical protein
MSGSWALFTWLFWYSTMYFCARYGHSVTGCKFVKKKSQLTWRVKGQKEISSVGIDKSTHIVPSSPPGGINPLLLQTPSMANYPCNPFAFVPDGLAIDHGPQNRRVRCDLAVSAVPPLNHDNYAIAETNLDIPIQQRFHARRELRRMLRHDGYQVCSMEDYAIGLGLFSFLNQFIRDTVVGRTYLIDDWLEITFVRHDEAINMRPASLGQEKWVMFLNFPLDYQTDYWVARAVDLFGRMLVWHTINDDHDRHARVLVKVWLMGDALVPRSLVLRQMGGHRRS